MEKTIRIGRYQITELDQVPGKFWVKILEGEGMEVDVSKLEELLDEFFEREF